MTAVVVPSPALSLVFVATSLTISAPMFSNLSASVISLAIETPSLVMVGEPHELVESDIAAARTDRHLDRTSDYIDAVLQGFTNICVKINFFCHM